MEKRNYKYADYKQSLVDAYDPDPNDGWLPFPGQTADDPWNAPGKFSGQQAPNQQQAQQNAQQGLGAQPANDPWKSQGGFSGQGTNDEPPF